MLEVLGKVQKSKIALQKTCPPAKLLKVRFLKEVPFLIKKLCFLKIKNSYPDMKKFSPAKKLAKVSVVFETRLDRSQLSKNYVFWSKNYGFWHRLDTAIVKKGGRGGFPQLREEKKILPSRKKAGKNRKSANVSKNQ